MDRIEETIRIQQGPGRWFTREDVESIPDASGAYLLFLQLEVPVSIVLPRLSRKTLGPGHFVYAGSARGKGGIRSRVRRHFRSEKKMHWHIDQLSCRSSRVGALAVPMGDECSLIETLENQARFCHALKGFGSSDCKTCESHLLAISDS